MRGPSTDLGSLVAVVVAAAVATLGTALLARSLFGCRRTSWTIWVLATAGPAAGLALIASVLPRASTTTAPLYGVLPCLALGVAVVLGGADRRRCARFAMAAGLWAVVVAAYWLLFDRGDPRLLVWASSDQLEYHRIATEMMGGSFGEGRYMIGLPTLLVPFELIGGVRTGSFQSANIVNLVALPFFVVLIGGATVVAIAEAATSVVRRRSGVAFGLAATIAVVVLSAYVTVVPSWVPDHNAGLVPRRLLGLVFAPEPLAALFLGGALWLLADAGYRRARWDPVLIGLAAGFVMLMREPNALIVMLVAALLLGSGEAWRRVVLPGAVATPILVGQLSLWHSTYGKVLAPNRDEQWDQPVRVRHWIRYAGERYGYESPAPPPRIAMRWMQTNLPEVVAAYAAPLFVAAILLILLALGNRRQWRLWVFATVFTVGTIVFNAAYINPDVLFRYNAVLLPLLAVVAAAGTLSLLIRTEAAAPGVAETGFGQGRCARFSRKALMASWASAVWLAAAIASVVRA